MSISALQRGARFTHALEIRALTGTGEVDPAGFDRTEFGDEPHDPLRGIKRVNQRIT